MFRLNTFGGLSLDDGSGLGLGRAGQRRRLALLATLAAARGSPVSRDKLIGWFWPEHDTAAARHALAQAVYAIRRSMGEAAVLGGAADDLRLNTEVVVSDVAAFVAAVNWSRLISRSIPSSLDIFKSHENFCVPAHTGQGSHLCSPV